MGKKNRHSQDRLFITATEWAREYGGKRRAGANNGSQALPFDHCAMSLAPFETPVSTKEGVVFDILNLIPYLQKHKSNPVTGEAMTPKDIIRLNMFKNSDGQWHCPVTCKVFNNNSHIVAIRTSGNVYCFDAVQELNIKPKNYVDLLTGEPFVRTDILTIQDPSNTEVMARRDISNFVHLNQVREDLAVSREQESKIRTNPIADSVKKEIDRLKATESDRESKYKEMQSSVAAAAAAREYVSDVSELLALNALTEDVTLGQVSTAGKAGSSLTSSRVDCWTDNSTRLATAEEFRTARWRTLRAVGKKAFAQIQTTHGNLNVELHCDMAQRTCWNFITLANRGYYNDTVFHRLVPGFMVQGGDPTATGSGGESAWGGKPFRDEFDSRLLHDSRGVLSMANSGPNTNGSQFFITFSEAKHLDNIHTVFGRVVGGLATLARIEEVGAGTGEKPLAEIKIVQVQIFNSPIEEADQMLMLEIKFNMAARIRAATKSALPSSAIPSASAIPSSSSSAAASSAPPTASATISATASASATASTSASVTTYAASATPFSSTAELHVNRPADTETVKEVLREKKRLKSSGFGDFSGW